MNINDVKYNKSEKMISENKNIRTEIKGLGPEIRVLRKSRISVTNERIIISQKSLFGSYIVQFIIWLDKPDNEKIHLLKGFSEISVSKNNINEISVKRKIITEINFDNTLKYIRIFLEKEKLFLKK